MQVIYLIGSNPVQPRKFWEVAPEVKTMKICLHAIASEPWRNSVCNPKLQVQLSRADLPGFPLGAKYVITLSSEGKCISKVIMDPVHQIYALLSDHPCQIMAKLLGVN